MKWAGKLFGNLNENPKRQSERGPASFFFFTLKETVVNLNCMNRVNKTN